MNPETSMEIIRNYYKLKKNNPQYFKVRLTYKIMNSCCSTQPYQSSLIWWTMNYMVQNNFKNLQIMTKIYKFWLYDILVMLWSRGIDKIDVPLPDPSNVTVQVS